MKLPLLLQIMRWWIANDVWLAGIVGLSSGVAACPYDIPPHLPGLLMVLADHLHDPQPISGTVKQVLQDFKRTHQDNWAEHKVKTTGTSFLCLATWRDVAPKTFFSVELFGFIHFMSCRLLQWIMKTSRAVDPHWFSLLDPHSICGSGSRRDKLKSSIIVILLYLEKKVMTSSMVFLLLSSLFCSFFSTTANSS